VRGIVTDATSSRRTQSFLVWADGLAVYREADRALDVPGLSLPVFATVSMYRLDPRSIRTLCRLLARAGLLDAEQEIQDNRDRLGQHVVLGWRAFGQQREISSMSSSLGSLDRSIRIVNSFLPPGKSFEYATLAGEIEPPHVSQVPAPLDSPAGAVECHRKLVELFPDDAELWIDLLAVAVAADDLGTARKALAALSGLEPDSSIGPFGEIVDWQEDVLAPLSRLVEGRARGAR
jgi:hypothetical protein